MKPTKVLTLAFLAAIVGLFSACPPPTITDISVTTASLPGGFVGDAYSQTLAAADGNGAYTWTIDSGSLPPGLVLSAAGTISGTPATKGAASFTVRASDGVNNAGTKALSIAVDGLEINAAAVVAGQNGVAYSAALSATGGTAPYTWTIASGALPAGLALDGVAGTIGGTPTANGANSFTLRVADSAGHSLVSSSCSLTIVSGVPVGISTASLPNAYRTGAYSQALAATGGSGIFSWTVKSGSLPAGLSLDGATGAVTGTPSAVGSFTAEIQVAESLDALNAFSRSFSIQVYQIVTMAAVADPSGVVGQAYSKALSASGGTGAYNWSVASGTLPGGLSLDPGTGVISGTPTATGSASVTIAVTDAAMAGNAGTGSYSVTVYDQVAVSTSTLSSVGGNRPFVTSLSASGGAGAYTWTVVSGSLPQDVSLSAGGAFSGYPAKPGTYNFTVRSTDSANAANYGERALSLTVTNFD